MLSNVFERVYGKLVGAFVTYDDAKAGDTEFSSFVTAWLALDDARIEMRQVHADMAPSRTSAVRANYLRESQDRSDRVIFQVRHLSS